MWDDMPSDGIELRQRARRLGRERSFDDFTVGQRLDHRWGRTITEGDSITFSMLTLSYVPQYYNREHATNTGHPDLVVNPMLVFLTTFGLSVEDLSEGGGPFLGVDDLVHHRPVHVGETLHSTSTVLAARVSASRPGTGIVTWHTIGTSAGEPVIEFRRSNLLRRAGAAGVL
jgi:itaconyl-CoA hydratase